MLALRPPLWKLGVVSAAIVGLVSCSLPTQESWRDQLVADTPCFRVNLLDGLDESSTEELHSLFACVNWNGGFEPVEPLVDAMDSPTRDGDPAGVRLAILVNDLPNVGIDVFALAGLALEGLQTHRDALDTVFDVVLETTYGAPADEVRSEGFDLQDTAQLQDGLLVPAGPLLPEVLEALIADHEMLARWSADLLKSDETHRWLRTVDAWIQSENPDIKGPIDSALPHLGELLIATRSPENDRWPSATGDSLRDLAEVLTGGERPLIEEISPRLDDLMNDIIIRTNLQDRIVSLEERGHLSNLGEEVAWMASVGTDGLSLDPLETSALHRFLRLLAAGNQPMVCTLDLWITDLEVDLGNLAVTILETLSESDPDTAQWGLGILSDVLGWTLSEWLLEEVADSGVCPALTPQMIDDTSAIDVMYRPEAYDLLVVVIELLDVVHNGSDDHLPTLVDVVTVMYDRGTTEPLEELVRDIGDSELFDDVIELLPVFADPSAYDLRAGDQPATDFQDVLDLIHWAVEFDATVGLRGWERLEPLMLPLVRRHETWDLLQNLAGLLVDERTAAHEGLELIPALFELDSDFVALEQIALLLGDPEVAPAVLRILDTPALQDALLATTPQGEAEEVPLVYFNRLIVDGTLDDILQLLDIALGSFDTSSDPSDP